eukprot:SAG31_NODE_4073_length_3614_cov_3.849218_4_plen_120_part_00
MRPKGKPPPGAARPRRPGGAPPAGASRAQYGTASTPSRVAEPEPQNIIAGGMTSRVLLSQPSITSESYMECDRLYHCFTLARVGEGPKPPPKPPGAPPRNVTDASSLRQKAREQLAGGS